MPTPDLFDSPVTLVELLETKARTHSGKRLYTFLDEAGGEEGALTFQELDLRARRIGAALQALAGSGERAVLLYPPGLEYIAGFFGCLYSGLIAVPAYPPDPTRLDRTLPRLRAIIQDARASVVLTTSPILELGAFLFEQAPDLAELKWLATDVLAGGVEDGWRRPEAGRDTLAFLQYTSGSTGTPRGVMLSHGNLLNNLTLISRSFQVRPDSVGVIWLPPYHDMGLIGGILEPLHDGIHTVLMSPLAFLKRPRLWLEAISRFGGTISGGPNFAFELCVRRIPPGERAGLDLGRWELAFCGAEPIRPEALARFAEAFAPCGFRRESIYPCYGLAEGTLIASGGDKGQGPLLRAWDAAALERGQGVEVPGAPPGSRTLVGCGRELPDQALRIVDPETRLPSPPGRVGEIWLAGPSVARGYWQNPGETERTFQARLADSGEGPFLRTGDLGLLHRGELFVTGRLKDLIILRGRNLYPQDLELTVERSHPALRPGCGAAFSIEVDGEEQLAVVQEVDSRRAWEPEEVIGAIRRHLSEAHEVHLHALALIEPGSLPKTSSGKIQRRACRTELLAGTLRTVLTWREEVGAREEAVAARPDGPTAHMGPAGIGEEELEAWLRPVLSAKLRVRPEELAPDVPITRFGLDSLAAVELAHELERGLGVTLPMEALLQGPSLARLARQLSARRAEQGAHSPAPLRRIQRVGELPLSFAQQRLWFLNQLEPDSPFYNLPAAVRLRGALDLAALERCFAELVRRHESLRTSFRPGGDGPVQVISLPLPLPLAVVDVGDVSEAAREEEVQRLAGEEARRPFDLSRGPLLRTLLLRLGEREHVLVLTMHHIVSDGWSMGVLVREVGALYPALSAGRPSPLPEPSIQYADYAAWQRERLTGEVLDAQLAYWRRRLEGAPPVLELPADRPRPPTQSFKGAHARLPLPGALSEGIRALARQEAGTPFMVLLAAFQTLLHRYTGQADLVVGTDTANRAHPGIEGLIGFFVNQLVLRVDLSGAPTFRELLGRVRAVALEAYAHQELPFEELVKALNPERSLGHAPIFQVKLTYQDAAGFALELPGLALDTTGIETGATTFDLNLSVTDAAGGLTFQAEYATDLFEPDTMARLLGHLRTLLEGVVASPERRLGELPLLTEAERRRLLTDWNPIRADFPKDACVHELFAAQAARTPGAVAVSFEGQQLTYRELDLRTNRLAHHLRALGVGPEVRVALYLERSLELVVGLIGILKAGGAYVPLDPSNPPERLAFTLESAAVPVLVSTEALAERLPSRGEQLVCLDSDWPAIARQPDSAPVSGVVPDHLAYVIYTSGSTGRPKGVAVGHRQLCSYTLGVLERLAPPPGASFASVSTIAADLGNTMVFPALCSGGTLHVLSRDRVTSAGGFAEYVQRYGIDYLKIVPSHLAALMSGPNPERVLPRRMLVLGGEASHREWIEELQRLAPGCAILNHYGPTETTVGVLTWPVPRSGLPGRPTIPMGWPLPGAQVLLLDPRLEPVPVGIAGEVYIGGAGLARGYLDQLELTAERFVPNPFSAEPGRRLYRTGDLARRLPDGAVEFLGRIDNQVKIRGFRVELAEIEGVLGSHPDVREVTVQVREAAPGDRRLVAYTVPVPERATSVEGRRRYLLPNKLAVVQLNRNETDYIYREIFELQAYLRHGVTLDDGDCIFDVGANIGLFSVFATRVCRAPRIYAFEPNPTVHSLLRINTALYGSDVTLFDCGLAAREGQAEFTFFPGFSLLSGFHADAETEKSIVKAFVLNQGKAAPEELARLANAADELLADRFEARTFTARLRTLSDIIDEQGIERIDLLKVNVEKSELDVLSGIREEHWSRIRQMVVEIDVEENLEPIVSLVRRHGYELVVDQDVLLEGTQLCYLYAIRPTDRGRLIREQEKDAHLRKLPIQPEPFLTAGELGRWLSERLPSYMVPSAFVLLEVLPLTDNGKLDRQALPAPDVHPEEKPFVAPRTPTEERLAALWRQLLGIERVGANDDFFELGGHSLLATQLASRLRSTFQVELSVRDLFAASTLAAQAGRIDAASRALAAPPLVPQPRTGRLPLSFSQQRLWFLDQLEPGSPLYNIAGAVRLDGPLEPDALERSIGVVIERHEALRTTFRAEAGEPFQLISPPGDFRLPAMDLRPLAGPAQEAEVERLAGEEARGPFDLAAGPLLRATLLRLSDSRHVLLLTMHHIVSDGWSMRVLIREVAALYAAFSSGAAPSLPPLPIQYADFALWQRAWLAGDVLEAQLAYWRQQLAGAPETLELPTDRLRPAVQSFRGASLPLQLPRPLSEALEALGREQGATPFMVLLAAFQVLLHRYSGQEDVCVGSPIAGRNRTEVEGLIGFFVNTLVLRSRLSPGRSFLDLLRHVRDVTLDAYAHQDVPFEKLVEALQPARSLGHSPLFQVMLEMFGDVQPELALPGLVLRTHEVERRTAKFDLNLSLATTAGGLSGTLEYNTDLFEADTIARMLGHLRVLLEGIVADPSRRLSALSLLTEPERHRLLVEWNDTRADFPEDACIHALFEARAIRTPDAIAVELEGACLTYRQLDERANRLAHHLRELGVGPGVLVALCAERSLELPVGLLGILKAGGAYVPLDPSYPRERLSFMLDDTRAPVLLTQEQLAPALPHGGARVVLLDSNPGSAAGDRVLPPAVAVDPRGPAYAIYTSGSTGRAKGVLISHRALVNHMAWLLSAFGLGADDRVLQKTPLSFDASVWECWAPLLVGGRLVLAAPGAHRDGGALLEAVVRHGVTVLQLVPSVLRAMLEDDGFARATSLRWLFCGGEALPAELARRFRALLPSAALVNLYGPTEVTIDATFALPREEDRGRTVPIGRPIANTRAYALDGDLEPVPLGIPGELYLGGEGLSPGYLDRPELTAERFIPDPFGGTPGGRLYRTGDRVRYLPDGALEYLGRVDDQVKVRGFRIELGEIEAALRRHPRVRAAAVAARDDVPGERQLVAYLVPPGDPPGAAELRAFLKETLPGYMVPSAFVALESLPQTPSGKLDRRALPAPARAGAGDTIRAAPRTPTEELLAGIWARVLRVDRVGRQDDFFALGGHSLLATQLVSRVRGVFGVELPLRELFEAPTLEQLAGRIEAAARAGHRPEVPPLSRIPRTGALPLSFAQQRLWFLHQLDPVSTSYHVPLAIRLQGRLDAAVLERCLGELIRRHEVLRTTFQAGGEGPVQVAAPPTPVSLEVRDLFGLPTEERDAGALRLAAEELRRPFDLEHGPLLRPLLLRMEARDHVLLLTMHHIVSDGWSLGVLSREVSALYEAFLEGRPSPLPELPVQYADFASWQRRWLREEVLEEQLAWWRRQLEGAPPALELPTDRPRPAVQTFRGTGYPVRLPRELSDALGALCLREGVTPFMALLAAFQALLSRYSGQDDVCTGTPIAGRGRAETEGLIGFFVNTLVLRLRLDGRATFRALLAQAREVTLGAYAHQELPFERLVDALQPPRDLGRTPLFQVVLALQNAPMPEARLPDLLVRRFEVPNEAVKFDLGLDLSETPAGLAGVLEYSTDLFDASTIARMVEHLRTLLEAAVADPEQRLSALPLLSEAERRLLLVDWNATKVEYPREASLPELFEEQVALRPDAVALESAGERLTYRELATRVHRLAQHLRRRGVGPDVRVALCLDRSVELVVAVLGILEAGGAYVPLDPAYPRERLAAMLEDARPGLLVATRRLREQLPAEGLPSVLLDEVAAELAREPAEAPRSGVGPRNLAYVDFTSGSTGRPKGVAIEHRSVARLVKGAEYARLGPEETFLLIAPISFDASTLELFGPLLNGGRLVVYPPHPPNDVEELEGVLKRHGVTTLHLTAGLMAQVVDARLEALRGLRQLLTGGDVVSAPHVRRVLEEVGCPVTACYGPTESTTFTSCHRMVAPSQVELVLPIGRPIANTRVYVLDRGLRLAPIGVPGELYVGGDGVARGYLERPELTAERFLPDPFGGEPGARLYRTGDRVRRRVDGVLEFLGRIDTQVKIRGFRVELEEVEAALARHPAVREALALAREDVPGDKRLVGYVAPAPGEAIDVRALRGFLEERLPGYMVPSSLVVLDRLPLTVNGKVDRRALPPPGEVPGAPDASFVAPRGPIEEALAALWGQLLGAARVGVHDSFFELGGHSLLATRLVSRVRAAFGVALSLRDLFMAPTVAGLAARLAGASQLPEVLRAPPLRPAPRQGPLPLSFAQQRLFFLDQLQPDSAFYNMPWAAWLEGPVDAPALERAFAELIRRHEALRTTFRLETGEPVQVIAPPPGPTLAGVELRELPGAAGEAEALRAAQEELQRPFDLARGPLLRAVLLRAGECTHLLVVTMHHIVSDGWSVGVLVRELVALYEAFSAGRPSPLPGLPLQYADYALWQRAWLQGDALAAQLDYWRRQLAGAPRVLELPTDLPRPVVQSFRGASLPARFPAPLSDALRVLCRREGVTPFMALLAAFQLLLSRYSGQDDVCVGSPIAGRGQAELEGLIGFFVNTLVLRTRLAPELTFRELLGHVREVALGAYAHQDLPFEKLVEELQPARSLSHPPLFQVVLAVQNAPLPTVAPAGLRLRPVEPETHTSKFDLTLSLTDAPEGLIGALEYCTDLFEMATAARMLEHLRTLLEGVVADPGRRLGELPLMDEAERRRLLVEWNDTRADYPREASLPAIFEIWAARTPEAVAVEFEGARLTYRELDRRANQLAHYLSKRGVGPGTSVGLCVQRSLELVVGTLGILKAGGAYVPLDPTYPRERLAFMVEDTRLPVLLTQRPLMEALPTHGAAVVPLDEAWNEIAKERDDAPGVAVPAEALAYVMYTSGSTGHPKGVCVPHRAVARLVLGTGFAELGPREVLLQLAPICFDAATFELWGSLLHGSRLVLFPSYTPTVDELKDFLARHGVTTLWLTAALFEQLSSTRPEALSAVRQLLAGGDVLPPAAVRERLARGGVLVNGYGPTEGTTFSCCHRMEGTAPEGAVPIGRPIANTRAFVVDPWLQPVPIGVPGELLIGGDGLAWGYLQRPELTAERFLPDPFGSEPGGRLYRTGDLVRYRPDGLLEFLGRLDAQVKVRGYRVEPGEVEEALRRHPAVGEAVVVARPDPAGGKRLVAYAVPRPGQALEPRELRAFLAEQLPEYMVPAALVPLAALPLSPNGKVDRQALPPPEARPAEAGFVEPTTPLERQLAALWARVLGVERVGVQDHFFEELGGSSMAVIKACALLREELKRDVPVTRFFEHPTVRALAASLEQDAQRETGPGDNRPHQDRAEARRQALRRQGRKGSRGNE